MGQYKIVIFNHHEGNQVIPLTDSQFIIGRQKSCDIILNHQTVSKQHVLVKVTKQGYHVRMLNHEAFIYVEGKKVNKDDILLTFGKSFQIGLYAIEVMPEHQENERLVFEKSFNLLPSSMKLEYRIYEVETHIIFAPGDTVIIGSGGILVPKKFALPSDRVLEFKFIWPTGQLKYLLGEVVGDQVYDQQQYYCIKLHQLKKENAEFVDCFNKTKWAKV